jgi:hypothetical protein
MCQLFSCANGNYDASAFDTLPSVTISHQDRESEEVLARIHKTQRRFFSKSHRRQRYIYRSGYFPGLHKKKKLTISEAKADCARVQSCAGFTYFSHSHSPAEAVWIDFTEETSGFVPDGKGYWHSYFKPKSMWHLPEPDAASRGFFAYQAAILPPGNDLRGAVTTIGAAQSFCMSTKKCAGFQVSLEGNQSWPHGVLPPDTTRAIIDYKGAITGFRRMLKLKMMYSYVKKMDAKYVAAAAPTPLPTFSPTLYPTGAPSHHHYVSAITLVHHQQNPHKVQGPIPSKGYTAQLGYLPKGHNSRKAKTTLPKAVKWCRTVPSSKCAGFSFIRPVGFVASGPGATTIYFDFKSTTKGFTAVSGADGSSSVITGPGLNALSCDAKAKKAGTKGCTGSEWVTFIRVGNMYSKGSDHSRTANFALHIPQWLSKPSSAYSIKYGYLPPGHNFQPAVLMKPKKAELLCSGSKACAGFTFAKPSAKHAITAQIYFKTTAAGFVSAHASSAARGWLTYVKKIEF